MSSLRGRSALGLLIPIMLATLSPATASAQDIPCQDALSLLLSQHGQSLDTFSDVQVRPYTWDRDPSPQGWRFSGVPPRCTGGMAGGVVASLWTDCSVTDIYTTGNCRISGIRDGWY